MVCEGYKQAVNHFIFSIKNEIIFLHIKTKIISGYLLLLKIKKKIYISPEMLCILSYNTTKCSLFLCTNIKLIITPWWSANWYFSMPVLLFLYHLLLTLYTFFNPFLPLLLLPYPQEQLLIFLFLSHAPVLFHFLFWIILKVFYFPFFFFSILVR